jgi:hypothetical protein
MQRRHAHLIVLIHDGEQYGIHEHLTVGNHFLLVQCGCWVVLVDNHWIMLYI